MERLYKLCNILIKANSYIPFRSPATLIHACHAATLPLSDCAVSFVKVRVVDGNIRTASLFLVTTFVELRVVAGRSRNADRSPTCRLWTADANSHLPWRSYAALMRHCAVVLRSCFQKDMVVAWQENGMACVNQTRPQCVNQMGKTQSKPLA
jgi:hypothetical protein